MSFASASTSSAPNQDAQQQQRDPETYLAQALTSPHLPKELRPFYEAFDRFWRNRSVAQAASFPLRGLRCLLGHGFWIRRL